MKLSVVTTLYRSEATVQAFHERMALAARAVAADTEFVYVNDGSPDASLKRILEIRQGKPDIVVLDLARNFGHHPALMTGLEAASGDFIFLIDSDLEEPPELLAEFWQALAEHPGADCAYGVQESRKGGLSERFIGAAWYAFFCRFADVPYPANSLTARLMTRRFVDSVLLHKERDLDMMGVFALAGYEQIAIPAPKGSKGATAYTAGKRLRIAATGLTSFTTAPLAFIGLLGGLITLAALGFGLLCALLAWRGDVRLGTAGFAAWSIWFIGGLLLSALGVLAAYLRTILQETKARPRVIVRRVYGAEKDV